MMVSLRVAMAIFLIFSPDEQYIFLGKGDQRLCNLCEVLDEDAQDTASTEEATYLGYGLAL
jgi:hypothetical protein